MAAIIKPVNSTASPPSPPLRAQRWARLSPNSLSGNEPPPPYQASPSPNTALADAGSISFTPATPLTIPFSSAFRAHQALGIYKISQRDMLLVAPADDPNPLCYISTHPFTRPRIDLHSTSDPRSSVLATAEFRHLSSSTTLTAGPVTQPLSKDGLFMTTWSMYITVPSTGFRERFEWRNSSGLEVQMLEGRSKGKKFVKYGTGEVLAVYAPESGRNTKKMGKLRWVGGKAGSIDIGAVGELLCVVSLLAMLEKERKSRDRSVAGVAGGGGGGSSGGGGC